MYHDKPRVPLFKKWLRPLVIVLILGVLCWGGILWQQNVTRDLDQQAAQQLKETVQRAAVQCYAVEGVFPENLEHLEENYGLQINHEKFIVTYDAFSSNLMPDIQVLQK